MFSLLVVEEKVLQLTFNFVKELKKFDGYLGLLYILYYKSCASLSQLVRLFFKID
jgi:hypothetical protein